MREDVCLKDSVRMTLILASNKASDSMTAKLKRLLDWNGKDMDTTVLNLYYWQNNALNNLVFCVCLRTKFKVLKKDRKGVVIVSRSSNPDDIIHLVKSSVENLISTYPAEVHIVEHNIL